MFIVKQLDFQHLSSAVLKNYKPMLDERYWRYLKSHADPKIIVIGITKDDDPVGIAAGEIFEDLYYLKKSPRRGEIFQLHLNPDCIHPKLINEILEQLETFFKKSKCVIINFTLDKFPELESVMTNRGWKGPRYHTLKYTFDSPSFTPDWFNQMIKTPLPEGYQIFKWSTIKKGDWEAVKKQEKAGVFPYEVSPFHVYSGPVENLNSLGLKYQDEVIGWVITHRIKSTIRYTSLFLQPAFQKRGLSVKLLAEAIKLQQNSQFPEALMEINLRLIDSSWRQFIEKYLKPYAASKKIELEYWLELQKPVQFEEEDFD